MPNSKKFKFNYIKAGVKARPIIPVEIIHEDKPPLKSLALLDSGADFNLFHSNIADALGIDLSNLPEISFGGVGDKQPRFKGKQFIIKLRVSDRGNMHTFDSFIVFSDDIPPNGYSLLGQQGFFNNFTSISFEYKRGKVILEV